MNFVILFFKIIFFLVAMEILEKYNATDNERTWFFGLV